MSINRKELVLSREQLREIQMVELEILIEVDRICRKNDIKYVLGYGSLLGAVRHKGFIPWDDDIDILMLRSEYDKFNEACQNQLDTSRFFWQTWDTDPNYRIGYGKMRRLDTEYVRVGQEKMKYHGGIPIDIMPLDNVPDKSDERKKFLNMCWIYRKLMYSKAGSMCEKNIFKRCGYKVMSFIPKDWIKYKFMKYANRFNDIDVVNVRCLFAMGMTVYYKDIFYERVELEFEGYKFYSPKDYIMFLRTAYGYYFMTPPPEDERYGHAAVSSYKTIKPDFLNR